MNPDVDALLRTLPPIAEILGLKVIMGKALCPFHSERTPSFWIGRDPQDGHERYRCFGCHVHGDAVDALAKARGLTSTDVLRQELARDATGPHHRRPPVATPPPLPIPHARIPANELRAVWEAAPPATTEVECYPDAARWLRSRGLDPWEIERRDLARVLPTKERIIREIGRIPQWMTLRGQPWHSTEHALLLPTYDEHGIMVGVRARSLSDADPKTVAPAVGRGAASGMVLANQTAIAMLKRGPAPLKLPIVIVEGEPDYLTWATRDDLAVLGVWSGAWNQAIANRIPSGAQVIIRTDNDSAGDSYAQKILESIMARCEILRKKAL